MCEEIWMDNVLHCFLMHPPAQMDEFFSLAQLQDVDSQTSTGCALQCHHTGCPQVVIRIKPQRSVLLCCNAFQVKILLSSMTIKSGLLWNVRLNDGKSVYLQLLPRWETNQDNMAVPDPAEGPGQKGPKRARRILSALSPHSTSERSQIFTLNIFLWFLVIFL